MSGPALLLSNPPRAKNGQFKKKRKAPRRSTTAKRTTTRRRASSNPPARGTRRRRPTTARAFTLKTLLPQTAAGVGGFMLADAGTRMVVKAIPQEVRSKTPIWAMPIIKAGVAVVAGKVLSSKHVPNDVRKLGPALALGGLISAGGDAWALVRPKLGLSGYVDPARLNRPLAGYELPGVTTTAGGRQVYSGDVVDMY